MKQPNRQNGLFYTTLRSPLGLIGLASSKRGIMRILIGLQNEEEFVRYLKINHQPILVKNPQAFKGLQDQFGLYFKGKLKNFACTLDLSAGTPFQSKVWQKLMCIPYGETRSYLWLAQAIGKPTAYRAVGNANGKNPVSIIVPCHRIIQENGDLGGYTGGINKKQFLLELEQSHYGFV